MNEECWICVAVAKTAIQEVQFLKVSSGRTGSLLWEENAGQAIFRPKSLLNSYIFSFGREKAEKGPAMAEEKSSQIVYSNQPFCIVQNAHLTQVEKRNSFWAWFPWAGVGIVILAVAVRAVALDRPLLGNFATKNVVLAMIARNWAEGRSPWWYPTVDVLVNGQRGLHLLELPLGAYVVGGVWRALGGALEVWGRVCSVAFYGAAVAVFFLWVRTLHGERTARGAAMMLALSPVGIIYGQSFMLDASLVCFTVVGLASLDAYLRQGGRLWWGLATGSFALLIVSKLYLAVWLIDRSRGRLSSLVNRAGVLLQTLGLPRPCSQGALQQPTSPSLSELSCTENWDISFPYPTRLQKLRTAFQSERPAKLAKASGAWKIGSLFTP